MRTKPFTQGEIEASHWIANLLHIIVENPQNLKEIVVSCPNMHILAPIATYPTKHGERMWKCSGCGFLMKKDNDRREA